MRMISIVIPAFREAERIGDTVAAVCRAAEGLDEPVELIVVDDGSDDGTAERALAEIDRLNATGVAQERGHNQSHLLTSSPPHPLIRVVRLEPNRGKGAALARGLAEARGELIVMLDADLGATADEFPRLLAPVRAGEADMTIAVFAGTRRQTPDASEVTPEPFAQSLTPSPHHPPASRVPVTPSVAKGGFGLALRTARWGVARLTGRVLEAPLSGQRALRAAHLPLLTPLEPGFGLEVGLDIDALRAGLRIMEVPVAMSHAATGRDWAGFQHRGHQLVHILRALARRTLSRSAQAHRR